VTNDPTEKAELLNKYFASVFTTDDGGCSSLPRRVVNDVSLSSVSFTPHKVRKKLRKLKPSTAGGPDGIQAILLKMLVILSPSLLLYFISFCSTPRLFPMSGN